MGPLWRHCRSRCLNPYPSAHDATPITQPLASGSCVACPRNPTFEIPIHGTVATPVLVQLTQYAARSTFDVYDSFVPMPGDQGDPRRIWEPEVSWDIGR